jgi:hypothetical protein
MRLDALVEAGDPEAIDVYLCEQDAQRALEDCLREYARRRKEEPFECDRGRRSSRSTFATSPRRSLRGA